MILTDEQAQEIADKILRAQDGRTVSAAMRDAIRATERAVLERLRERALREWTANSRTAYAWLGKVEGDA